MLLVYLRWFLENKAIALLDNTGYPTTPIFIGNVLGKQDARRHLLKSGYFVTSTTLLLPTWTNE